MTYLTTRGVWMIPNMERMYSKPNKTTNARMSIMKGGLIGIYVSTR